MNPIKNMWGEVKMTMHEMWPVSLPQTSMYYGPSCETRGMKLLRLRVTFDHWLSPWHGEWNQWSKLKGSGLLITEFSFWNISF